MRFGKVIRGLIIGSGSAVVAAVGAMHGITMETPAYWVVTVALLVIILAS